MLSHSFKLADPDCVYSQLLDSALAALKVLNESDFAQTADNIPQPYADFPALPDEPFDLPSILVPPEVIELDGLTTDTGEDAQVKKEEWPQYFVRLFDADVSVPLHCGFSVFIRTVSVR